jgi:hypothetical protein
MIIKRVALISALLGVLVIIGVVVAVLSSGLLVAQQGVPSSGDVGGQVSGSVNIGLYSDADASVNCSSVNWGSLSAGSSVTQTIYVKNNGSTSETLHMTTSDWTPMSAAASLTLSWNLDGTILPAGVVVPATITLSAAANTTTLTDFSFNIVVSGTSQ